MLCVATAATSLTATGTPASAHGGKHVTNYAFKGWSFGTYAATGQVGVTSGPTAYSWMGCTRTAGLERNRSVAEVKAPPGMYIGAVRTSTKTYHNAQTGHTGIRTTNHVAKVVLGDPSGPHLAIDGLESQGYAYASRDGKLHARNVFNSVDIKAHTGNEELDGVLNKVGFGLDDLIKMITHSLPDQQLEIPGVAMIRVGKTVTKVASSYAWANVHALRIRLYGPNPTNPADDVQVVIGRSHALIYKDVPRAVMGGNAYGIKATALEEMVTVGPIVERSVQCRGTGGVIKSAHTASANLGMADVVVVDGVGARAYGTQDTNGSRPGGGIRAWTEGRIAQVRIGTGDSSIVVNGIIGRATATQSATGTMRLSSAGTKILSLVIGGEVVELPDLGDEITIPGLARIQAGVVTKRRNFIEVVALRITLLEDTAAKTVVNLGKASAWIRRT